MLIKYLQLILLINIPISLAIRVSSHAFNVKTPRNESTLIGRNNLNLYSHKKDVHKAVLLKILPEKRRTNKHSWPDMPSPYLEPPKFMESSQRKIVRKKSNFEANIGERNVSEGRIYVRDHAPIDALHQQHESSNLEKKQEISGEKNLENKNVIQFHVHGHQGPDSYIFGYDTGLGNNRQFRLEERHKNGTVIGHYGYYDSRGKLRKVDYSAQPSVEIDDSHKNSHSSAR